MAEPTRGGPLRTVLVSAVRHAGGYTPLVHANPGYELVGVAESQDADHAAWSAARELADVHGVPLWPLGELGEGVADVAIVCSEPTRHATLAEHLLGLGLHVLVDKPIATDLQSARRVVAAADAAGRRCTVVTRALAPATRRVRNWVDAGRLGLPRSIDVEFLSDGAQFATAVERPELVADPRLSGGGEVMNFLGYPVDYIRAITGCEPVEVFAEASTLFWEPHREFGVEDVAVVSAAFSHGLMASIVVGRVPAAPGPGPGSATIRLVGSHGHIELDADGPVVTCDTGTGSETIAIDRSPVEEVLDELRDSIWQDRRPSYDCRDALIAVATVDAAYRSITTGVPAEVHIEP